MASCPGLNLAGLHRVLQSISSITTVFSMSPRPLTEGFCRDCVTRNDSIGRWRSPIHNQPAGPRWFREVPTALDVAPISILGHQLCPVHALWEFPWLLPPWQFHIVASIVRKPVPAFWHAAT